MRQGQAADAANGPYTHTRLSCAAPELCSLTVELYSLQVSEETTSSLIIKPGELQPGWYLFYGATWEAGLSWHWPCFLNRGKAFFPAPPYLPGRQRGVGWQRGQKSTGDKIREYSTLGSASCMACDRYFLLLALSLPMSKIGTLAPDMAMQTELQNNWNLTQNCTPTTRKGVTLGTSPNVSMPQDLLCKMQCQPLHHGV